MVSLSPLLFYCFVVVIVLVSSTAVQSLTPTGHSLSVPKRTHRLHVCLLFCCCVVSSEGEEHKHQDDLDKKVVAFDPNIIGARTDSFKSTRVGGVLGHVIVT